MGEKVFGMSIIANNARWFEKSVFGHFSHSESLEHTKWEQINYFMPLVSFCAPWKQKKSKRFFNFLGGLEKEEWHQIV